MPIQLYAMEEASFGDVAIVVQDVEDGESTTPPNNSFLCFCEYLMKKSNSHKKACCGWRSEGSEFTCCDVYCQGSEDTSLS